jgi:hypothetical protein
MEGEDNVAIAVSLKEEPLLVKEEPLLVKEEPLKEEIVLPKEEPLLVKEEEHKESHSDEEIEKYLKKFDLVKSDLEVYKTFVKRIDTSAHDQERIERLTAALNKSTLLLDNLISLTVDMNNIFS